MTESPSSPSLSAEPKRTGSLTAIRPDAEGWIVARPPRLKEVALRVLAFPSLVVRHRDLITSSVRRDLETRFQGSVLGWLWPLVHPIFLFLVYYFIFTKLLALKMPDLPKGQESAMGVYMFTGVATWASFAESVGRGCNGIVENGNLIKKLAFPAETLALNVVPANTVTMVFSLVVFVLVCALTPVWPAPGWALLWVPALILAQVTFTYGLMLLLSTLQVFLRDTLQVTTILITVWMFVTPLFWAPEVIPADVIEPYMGLIKANPMYHLVYCWRTVLMSSEPAYIFNGDFLRSLGIFSLWALGSFVGGYSFFVLAQRRFADEV